MDPREEVTHSYVHPCHMHFRTDLIPYTVIVVIEILFNLLVIAAIVVNRRKLKHNHVYMYVGSVVIANVALGVLFTYTLVNFMIAFERSGNKHGNDTHRFYQDDAAHRGIMTWWAFRKSIMVGFFLILSGNVSALIHGIANSAYFVGRSGVSDAKLRFRVLTTAQTSSGESPLRASTKQRNSLQTTKKRRTFLIIGSTWIFPLIYSLPTAFGWSCIDHCECLPGYYGGYQCIADNNPALCSHIWTPMTQVQMLIAAIIWFLQLFVIALNLFYALHKYYRSTKTSRPEGDQSLAEVTADIQPTVSKRESIVTSSGNHRLIGRNFWRPLHPTVKLLIGISVSYTVSTAPMIICILLDVANSIAYGITVVSDVAMTAVSSLVVFYCCGCPLLLISFMPGLRRSVIRLLMPCTCTSTKVSASSFVRARNSSKKKSETRS